MAKIEVTAEMLEAGRKSIDMSANPFAPGWLPTIYRAMRAQEPVTAPDPIRHTAMEYAVRCTPSRADLIPLALAIEAYLRGEVEPQPPVSLRELADRHGAMSPPLPAA